MRFEEVFGAMHADRPPLDQRGADGVGAGDGFAPVDAGAQQHLGCAIRKVRVSGHIQDKTGPIGQNHHPTRTKRRGSEGFKFRTAGAAQTTVLVLKMA
ncbi:hypothetical protein GALL_554110 [mine drainage metagenome]|uniref:Uncharacterized protein n=1 Tax=mine drainage metagenome TaxID=410659 RepID=A0A1J5NWE8_9ZZZZ